MYVCLPSEILTRRVEWYKTKKKSVTTEQLFLAFWLPLQWTMLSSCSNNKPSLIRKRADVSFTFFTGSSKLISHFRQGLKACAVLFPLLGMTWVFGLLSVTDAGLVFQYIFTILNSLQVHHLPVYVLRILGFLCMVLNVIFSQLLHIVSPITIRKNSKPLEKQEMILKNYGLRHDARASRTVLSRTCWFFPHWSPSFTDINFTFTGNPVNYGMLQGKVDTIHQVLSKCALHRSHRVFLDFKTARANALLLVVAGLVGNAK